MATFIHGGTLVPAAGAGAADSRDRQLPSSGPPVASQKVCTHHGIRAWVAGLRPEPSDSYVRTLFASLSSALNAAVTDGLITRNPCTSVKPPKASQGRVQPWTGDQVGAVRQYLPARYRALADLGAGLGLRQGGWRVSAGRSYAENQCAGAGLVLW
jgi:hypothetical protein